jgi:hypothetical protein
MEADPATPTDDEIETVDGTAPGADDDSAQDDRLDEGILAADDTGMLAGERMITLVELEEGDSGAGDV